MLQYLIRRIILFIPTLIAITVISFILIQLPEGDYLSAYISQMEATGIVFEQDEIDALTRRYGLDQPMYVQFGRWVWGLLRGEFGMSFRYNKPVREIIGDRLLLTVTISLSTLMLTWIVALPIGVYSATHQYSAGDYLATFFGFLGRAIPNFMLALVLMWVALAYFRISAGGLFSLEYRNAPWTWGKVVDLLKHMWVPMLVLGTAGTAGLIRTMRANLLDELNKPYVETARAKGVKERKVLWKYPVRLALNPFFSTVGYTLPNIISGSTIVSVVLSLPTTGPLLLESLMAQDVYLAGTLLVFVGSLTVVGTLISDILLAIIDPRIRLGQAA